MKPGIVAHDGGRKFAHAPVCAVMAIGCSPVAQAPESDMRRQGARQPSNSGDNGACSPRRRVHSKTGGNAVNIDINEVGLAAPQKPGRPNTPITKHTMRTNANVPAPIVLLSRMHQDAPYDDKWAMHLTPIE